MPALLPKSACLDVYSNWNLLISLLLLRSSAWYVVSLGRPYYNSYRFTQDIILNNLILPLIWKDIFLLRLNLMATVIVTNLDMLRRLSKQLMKQKNVLDYHGAKTNGMYGLPTSTLISSIEEMAICSPYLGFIGRDFPFPFQTFLVRGGGLLIVICSRIMARFTWSLRLGYFCK